MDSIYWDPPFYMGRLPDRLGKHPDPSDKRSDTLYLRLRNNCCYYGLTQDYPVALVFG